MLHLYVYEISEILHLGQTNVFNVKYFENFTLKKIYLPWGFWFCYAEFKIWNMLLQLIFYIWHTTVDTPVPYSLLEYEQYFGQTTGRISFGDLWIKCWFIMGFTHKNIIHTCIHLSTHHAHTFTYAHKYSIHTYTFIAHTHTHIHSLHTHMNINHKHIHTHEYTSNTN